MSTQLRIGEGWDIHALVAGRPLVLGGVTIAHTHGLLGHSDADALLHAITDALFGAAGLGDIGRHFPDTDAAFKDADSHALLSEAARRVIQGGLEMKRVGQGVGVSRAIAILEMTDSGADGRARLEEVGAGAGTGCEEER